MFGRNEQLTRRELYDLVWSSPMSTLSDRFRMSDQGLAKLCARYNVPLPERGCWAKKEAGQPVTQPPLEPAENQYRERIEIHVRDDPRDWLNVEELGEFDRLLQTEGSASADLHVVVAEEDTSREPEVVRIRRAIRHQQEPNGRGITKPAQSRAVRIMTALLLACEKREYAVESGSSASVTVRVGGEPVGFHIEEKYDQIDHVLTKSEERDKAAGRGWGIPKFNLIPSGNLKLVIHADGEGDRRTFGDTSHRRVEACLDEFMITLIRAAMFCRARKNYWTERERVQKEEQRRREEEAAHQAVEQERRRELFLAVVAFRRAESLRRLVETVKVAAVGSDTPIAFQEWIAYASTLAEQIDPVPRIVRAIR